MAVRCVGRPNHHTISYSDIDFRYCSAVKAVLTTTSLPKAVPLLVIAVLCEGRNNLHTITYSGIALRYCSVV